jgi:hypothetical protein
VLLPSNTLRCSKGVLSMNRLQASTKGTGWLSFVCVFVKKSCRVFRLRFCHGGVVFFACQDSLFLDFVCVYLYMSMYIDFRRN